MDRAKVTIQQVLERWEITSRLEPELWLVKQAQNQGMGWRENSTSILFQRKGDWNWKWGRWSQNEWNLHITWEKYQEIHLNEWWPEADIEVFY